MALSFVTYTGNGSNRIFNVTFQYLLPANVFVKVNNVAVTYIFLDSSRVQLTTAPAAGAVVEVRRISNRTSRVVDFQDGAVLTEAALDADSNQLFEMAQEAFDASNSTPQLDADNTFNALSKRIKNVANPVNAQDVATKNWSETANTSQVNIATAKAVISTTKAAEAAVSATASETSKTASGVSATASANSATAGAASASTATTQAATATTQAGLATTNGAAQVVLATAQKTIAVTKASESAASATASANSATASANSATAAASSSSTATTKASEASTSASNAAASLTSFNGKYVSQSSQPSSPSTGDLWFDTSSSTMKVYNGSAWANAGSSVNGVENSVQHTATAGQTSFAATYDAGYLQVFLNGIRLDAADYTATNGTAVVLAVAAAVGDTVFIQGFGTFVLADVYTKTASDARFKPIGASSGGPSLGLNSVIRTNAAVISESITINTNGMSAGPITIADGHTITIGNSGNWSIV